MSQKHYKLPIDDEIDKDILDWIDSFPRTKKGEMVRHAIRYYMSVSDSDSPIKFPNNPNQKPIDRSEKVDQATKNKRERKRPSLNMEMK